LLDAIVLKRLFIVPILRLVQGGSRLAPETHCRTASAGRMEARM
jgi:hypothetical protein